MIGSAAGRPDEKTFSYDKGSLIIFIIAVLQAPIICGSQPRPGSQPTRPLGVNQGPWEPRFCREALIYDGEPKTHLLVPAVFFFRP